MKKIIVMALACVMVGFTSCGNKTAENQEAVDSLATEAQVPDAETVVAQLGEKLNGDDPAAFATVASQAQEAIAKLLAAGDTVAAKEYASKIKAFVDANAEKVKKIASGNETINGLVNTVQATSITELANQAAAAVKADADHAANEVKDAADQKVQEAKDAAKAKVNEQVDAAKNKANEQIDAAKNKANEKMNEATDKALNKIGLK